MNLAALMIAPLLLTGATAAWVVLNTPARNATVFECMTQQQHLAPLLRADTCTCVADVMAAPISTVRSALSTAGTFRRLTTQGCEAKSYGFLGPDRSNSMRMSPLPTMGQ